MKKNLLLSFFLIFCLKASALEMMDERELASCTAQAGIDISISNLVIYKADENTSFSSYNPPNITETSLSFLNNEYLFTLDTKEDVNSDGFIEPLRIDIGKLSDLERLWENKPWVNPDEWGAITSLDSNLVDRPVLSIYAPDFQSNLNIRNRGITLREIKNSSEKSMHLGSFSLNDSKTRGMEIFVSAGKTFKNDNRKAGMDFELAFQKDIKSLSYKPSNEAELLFDNIYLAEKLEYTEDNFLEMQAQGLFRIGNIREGKNLSIDIGMRGNDSNAKPVLALNFGDIQGSFAISQIKDIRGGEERNFGPFMAEGIKVHHMKIELPGRN